MNKIGSPDFHLDILNRPSTSNDETVGNFFPPENMITFEKIHSLQNICTVRLIGELFKLPQFITIISDFFAKVSIRERLPGYVFVHMNEITDYKTLIERISELLSVLLPAPLQVEALGYTRPMALQVFAWLNYVKHSEYSIKEVLESIYWKGNGVIDKCLSVESLIKNKRTTSAVYEMACNNCLKHLIPKLWSELPESSKNHYIKIARKGYDLNLIAYWTCYAANVIANPSRRLQVFRDATGNVPQFKIRENLWHLLRKNTVAMEYFCQAPENLPIPDETSLIEGAFRFREKEELLFLQHPLQVRFKFRKTKIPTEISDNANIICTLFSRMNKEQQEVVMKKHSLFMLEMLVVDWPWRKFFFPLISLMWDFLDKNVYVTIAFRIFHYVQTGVVPEQSFPEQLWSATPAVFKDHFIRHITNETTYLYFLFHTDVTFFKLVLMDVSVTQKQMWFRFAIANSKLSDFLKECKLDCFDALLEEAHFCDSFVRGVKDRVIKEVGMDLCFDWIKEGNLLKVDQFLNWCFSTEDKIKEFKSMMLKRKEMTEHLEYIDQQLESINNLHRWINK